MKKNALLIVCLLLNNALFSQISISPAYYILCAKADSLYELHDFKNAQLNYSLAFKTLGNKGFPNDRISAACAWTKLNKPDSAFFCLQRIVLVSKYKNYSQILTHKDLKNLHSDKRWRPLLDSIQQNNGKEAHFYDSLIIVLDSLKYEDQRWRNYSTKLFNKQLGADTIPYKIYEINFERTDSLNYIAARKIFMKYGFPDYDLVGEEGTHNFWVLIQHQDKRPMFQDTVLTAMKVKVDKHKAPSYDYAYLVDRVKVNTGQLQIYGSQMMINKAGTSYTPKPLKDPETVNKRRKEMQLPPIEEYIKIMNERYYGSLKNKK